MVNRNLDTNDDKLNPDHNDSQNITDKNENKSSQDKSHDLAKDLYIVVNGRKEDWHQKEIFFKDVIKIAFDIDIKENESFDFFVRYKYENGGGGVMEASQAIAVKKGMMFDATKTDRS